MNGHGHHNAYAHGHGPDSECPQVVHGLEVVLAQHTVTRDIQVVLFVGPEVIALTDTEVVRLRTALDTALVAVIAARKVDGQ